MAKDMLSYCASYNFLGLIEICFIKNIKLHKFCFNLVIIFLPNNPTRIPCESH